MKFLVDAQLPPGLCRWLETHGHEAVHVTARKDAMADAAVARWAEEEGRILVTKDEDFRSMRLPDRFPLLWLRCGNTTNRALAAWLEARWVKVEALLVSGERMIELV